VPNTCQLHDRHPGGPLYILYDVNPVEGFNLRRDVYIRFSVFLKALKQRPNYENAKLVLPPFTNLYHWRSQDVEQEQVFWNHFFDLDSLKLFTDVIDIFEFFDEVKRVPEKFQNGKLVIDEVYKLQNFEDMFENGVFVDKFQEVACSSKNKRTGSYFNYKNITENKLVCMSFQGSAAKLYDLLEQYKPACSDGPRIVFFFNAETVLHDYWGNDEYWMARRSMRFNSYLVEEANHFRLKYFKSSNKEDAVQRPKSWLQERSYRDAAGGDYLCAHLRRADFLYGRESTTPSLASAASQIKQKLKTLGLQKVFISSDCSGPEFHDLKNNMKRYKVYRYAPESSAQKSRLKDGGVAIIDQIICSHAR
jgi:peptide-O-fucosyltransferase